MGPVSRSTSRHPPDIIRACRGLEDRCSWQAVRRNSAHLYDGVRPDEISQAMIFAAKARVEWSQPTPSSPPGCCSIDYRQALPKGSWNFEAADRDGFKEYLQTGVASSGRIVLLTFDLDRLAAGLRSERDEQFTYMGLQSFMTVIDPTPGRRLKLRILLAARGDGLRFMRATRKTAVPRVLRSVVRDFFLFRPRRHFSIPHAHPQLSSCYLSTRWMTGTHLQVISDDRSCQNGRGVGQRLDEHAAAPARRSSTDGEAGRHSLPESRQRHGGWSTRAASGRGPCAPTWKPAPDIGDFLDSARTPATSARPTT